MSEGKGWASGGDIKTPPVTDAYREGWDRIFGRAKQIHNSRMGVGDTCDDCIEIAKEQLHGDRPSN